ncbi:MAG: hypothetical protein ACYTFY_12895 [Planctomycetota bacterium]
MTISILCILLCAVSCQNASPSLADDTAVVTGDVVSLSALTRQKGETRMALRVANAVVADGKIDLSSHAFPSDHPYRNQHIFTIPFPIGGRIEGHKCRITLQGNTVVEVTGDWKQD